MNVFEGIGRILAHLIFLSGRCQGQFLYELAVREVEWNVNSKKCTYCKNGSRPNSLRSLELDGEYVILQIMPKMETLPSSILSLVAV